MRPMSDGKYEVVIVGAGPAGITAAIALAKAEIPVLVLEAGAFPGAENWSGAVYFTENLAQSDVLGEDAIRQAAWERPVTQRGVQIYNGHGRLGLTYRNPETFRHCYTVLRPTFDHYLAALARSFGATILTETTATGLVRDAAGKITGVQTTRGPVFADVVFLAEGDASHLVTKEGYERATEPGAPHFLQGVKEVIEMDPAEIERRFGRERRLEHAWVRRQADEREQDRPREGEGLGARELLLEPSPRDCVVRRALVDRVEEDVRVDELHLRSSSLRIVSASSSSPASRSACSRSIPGRRPSRCVWRR